MPTIFDNVENNLRESLRALLKESHALDACVGYFHLRGWEAIQDLVDRFKGELGQMARILVGMSRMDQGELLDSLSIFPRTPFDNSVAKRREVELMAAFNDQLTFGLPSNKAQASLKQLESHLKSGKASVKLFLEYPLHAKLYILYRLATNAELYGIVGSSNLTAPGLFRQGELNVDVADQDACRKLLAWFEERWNKPSSIEVTLTLAKMIENSWVGHDLLSPYLVYLRIVYHLAFEALEAPREYSLPEEFKTIVLDFQEEAIFRVRRYLENQPLAILADVVGMGKTLAATAVARMYQDDKGGRVIVCCPVKVVQMWKDYLAEYHLAGEVVPYSMTTSLPDIKGLCKLLILDESHNLRNRDTNAWAHIADFIRVHNAKVLLLSATPYNKQYEDLGNQLRLAIDEKADLGIRPEQLFKTISESDFCSSRQVLPTSLAAFEHSTYPDDWQDLLKRFLVRRPRSYIIKRFAEWDEERGMHFITLKNGVRSYFPKRVPKNLLFPLDDADANDQYARVLNPKVEDVISHLHLPRYGLGQYIDDTVTATPNEQVMLTNLSSAGQRLIGYCRQNLFKRLESSGYSFLLSIERHILRNLVFLYAIENGLDLPVGTQDATSLDSAGSDIDPDSETATISIDTEEDEKEIIDHPVAVNFGELWTKAKIVYGEYAARRKAGRRQFRWVSSKFFTEGLKRDLEDDATNLQGVLVDAGGWDPSKDAKIQAVTSLLRGREAESKVLIFTQFADTAHYLAQQLRALGIADVESVTAASANPANLINRFSPVSNHYTLKQGESPIRVLVATEVLSEGLNCQDAAVVINYDLPWAIIRLIQRAGRVDRIGQTQDEIRIYSCIPEDGVNRIINLRGRLLTRLQTNREVIGTDEKFFEEEAMESVKHVYAEDPGIYDDQEGMDDIDIPSRALGIWEDALQRDPSIETAVRKLPDQVYATREHTSTAESPDGALIYFKTKDGFDSLCRVDPDGALISQSLIAVLNAAACPRDTKALPLHESHHEIVTKGIKAAIETHYVEGGNLGDKRSARRRVYERLSTYRADLSQDADLFSKNLAEELKPVLSDIYQRHLTDSARNTFNRRLREGIPNHELAELAVGLRENGTLVEQYEGVRPTEPRLICSIGLFAKTGRSK